MGCSEFQTSIYQGLVTDDIQEHLGLCVPCAELCEKLSILDRKLKYQVGGTAEYHEYRKHLILQKVQYRQVGAPTWTVHMIRAASIFLLLAILFLPLARLSRNHGTPANTRSNPVPFEMGKLDQSVQLRWKGDPQKTYRVYKGASPTQLQLIGEFRGLQWTDASRNSISLVFYKIEAL